MEYVDDLPVTLTGNTKLMHVTLSHLFAGRCSFGAEHGCNDVLVGQQGRLSHVRILKCETQIKKSQNHI